VNQTAALWLALVPLLIAGLYALIVASHERVWYRFGPVKMVGLTGLLLAEKGLVLGGDGMTSDQNPLKGYLITALVLGVALTVVSLARLSRKHRGIR